MKETGIIMSGDHPKLILEGRKTQTRRTWGLEWMNQDPDAVKFLRMEGNLAVFHKLRNFRPNNELPSLRNCPETKGVDPDVLFYVKCPYGQVGDRLWVRETWAASLGHIIYKFGQSIRGDETNLPFIKQIDEKYPNEWRPSIFMPRWASRILLEITEVRVERLQDIRPEDVLAEGIPGELSSLAFDVSFIRMGNENRLNLFMELWDSLNAKRGYGWATNPWVRAISFKLCG